MMRTYQKTRICQQDKRFECGLNLILWEKGETCIWSLFGLTYLLFYMCTVKTWEVEVCSGLAQGLCLVAQIMFRSRPGSNDSNEILNLAFFFIAKESES
jgi:hypothetical protein